MGYIYKITNDVNDKVYIGQTIFPIEERFKKHIYNAVNEKQEYKFQKAILSIGPEHFTPYLIEEINDNLLDEREIYWISYYDSYYNGYNSTLGGSGRKRIDGKIEDEIIKLRHDGMFIRDIAKELNCCHHTVCAILKKHNLNIRLAKDEDICSLKEKGYTMTEIAKLLNCGIRTVVRALDRNNRRDLFIKNKKSLLKVQVIRLRTQGLTLQNIADEVNLSRRTIGKYLKDFMPEQVRKSPGFYDEQVQKLLLEGKRPCEILKIVGCSDSVVKRNKKLLLDLGKIL